MADRLTDDVGLVERGDDGDDTQASCKIAPAGSRRSSGIVLRLSLGRPGLHGITAPLRV
jgi:hypothetical protein